MGSSAAFLLRTSLAPLCGVVAIACNAAGPSPTDARLDSVEREITDAQARLQAVKAEVAEAEARAVAAQAEAEFQGCRARVIQLRAETERRRAQCAKDVADRNLCIAHNSERTATSGIVGCGLGLAFAGMTGGAAAPWALGGCAAGAGAGALSGDDCPAATCAANLERIGQDVLDENGLEAFPRCGGFAGIEVIEGTATAPRGVAIQQVRPGTYADSANLAAGDVLTSIQGLSVGTKQNVADVLRDLSDRQILEVEVVREQRLFHLRAPASRYLEPGSRADSPTLGATVGEPVGPVQYRSGVVVTSVVPGSPAHTTGLQAGDRIEGVTLSGAPATEASNLGLEQLEGIMGDLRPGVDVDFHLVRDGRRAIAHVRLETRAGRAQL